MSEEIWNWYFWGSFALSFFCALSIPSKLSTVYDYGGSAIISLFGFVLWPLLLYAALKYRIGN